MQISDKDEDFKKVSEEEEVDPQKVNWAPEFQRMPFVHWKWDTWRGLAAILSGALIQAVLGQVALWGSMVSYVASKYRNSDPDLTI